MNHNLAILVTGYKNILNINSRSTRKEFFLVIISGFILTIFIAIFLPDNQNIDRNIDNLSGLLYFLYILAGIRRNHDVGYSGFWLIMPLMNLIILIAKSEDKENKWGPIPTSIVQKEESKITKKILIIFKYFTNPKKKDWLFISLFACLFATIIMGTTLFYWWIVFFGIRIYLVRKNVKTVNSKDTLFISYSTHDQIIVSNVKDELLISHNIDSWWQKDIASSQEFKPFILDKIKNSSGAILMYSENFENSKPIQEWELAAIKEQKETDPNFSISVCIVGKHDKEKIPFADKIQIIPSRSEPLSRLTTSELKQEVKKLAKGLSKYVNIRDGLGSETYSDPRWFKFYGIFFMVGNFVYDSGLGYIIDPNYYD